MSTPLDKHGYVMSESDGNAGRYRLVIGFANMDDLQAAHEYIVKHCNCKSPTTEGYSAPETAVVTNGGMKPTCPNCGHVPCAEWCGKETVALRGTGHLMENCPGCDECTGPETETLCGSMNERGRACDLPGGHGGLHDWEQDYVAL